MTQVFLIKIYLTGFKKDSQIVSNFLSMKQENKSLKRH